MSMIRSALFAATVMAGAALLSAPASAQMARYCSNNVLVANSFYSNVMQSPRGGADVEYHGQFQNQDPNRRRMMVTLIEVARIGPFTFVKKVQRFDLDAFQQKDIALVTTHTTNQSGAGAPTPNQVAQNIRVSCSFS